MFELVFRVLHFRCTLRSIKIDSTLYVLLLVDKRKEVSVVTCLFGCLDYLLIDVCIYFMVYQTKLLNLVEMNLNFHFSHEILGISLGLGFSSSLDIQLFQFWDFVRYYHFYFFGNYEMRICDLKETSAFEVCYHVYCYYGDCQHVMCLCSLLPLLSLLWWPAADSWILKRLVCCLLDVNRSLLM